MQTLGRAGWCAWQATPAQIGLGFFYINAAM
jgi:hypothetical protein